jgi:hypothetical protein
MMGDEELRRRISERAIDIRNRFSLARVAGMWEQLFLKISK